MNSIQQKSTIALLPLLLLYSNLALLAMDDNQSLPELLVVEDIFPVYTRDFINEEIRALATSGKFSVSVFSEKAVTNPDHLAKLPDWIQSVPMQQLTTLPDNLNKYLIILADWGHIGEKIAQLKHEGKYNNILATRFRGSPEERIGRPDDNCYKHLKQYGDLYLPNCDFFRRELCNKFNFNPEKCIVRYGGMDVNSIKKMVEACALRIATKNQINIFSACRLEPKKGINIALTAIANILKKNTTQPIRYTIIGEGPQRAELEKQRETLGLTDSVIMLGGKSKKEVIEQLAYSDIFLAPSYTTEDGDTEGIMNSH